MKLGITDVQLPKPLILIFLVAIICMALAAILLIPTNDEGSRRLGIFMGILTPTIMVAWGVLRSEQTAQAQADVKQNTEATKANTENLLNGEMNAKMQAVVDRAIDKHEDNVRKIIRAELIDHDRTAHPNSLGH